jgi:hypothetical protein
MGFSRLATPSYTYPLFCLPKVPANEFYIPEVNNTLSTSGGRFTGANVNGGSEFTTGSVVTIVIKRA